MNDVLLQYGFLLVVAFLSGVLATALFFRKSLVKSHFVQLVSVVLVVAAIGIAFYEKFLSPPPPEAFAVCDKPGQYPPTTISCLNKSNDYSSIQWEFEDGTIIRGSDVIERKVEKPGVYVVKLIANGKGLLDQKQSVFETQFVVEAKPTKEPERITLEKTFSRSSKGAGQFEQAFAPEPGFKIVDVKLKTYSSNNASVHIVSQTADRVVVSISFTAKPILRGLQLEMERGWVEGAVILTQEKVE